MKSTKYKMSYLKFIFGLFLLIPFLNFAQINGQGKITGKISDAKGPLIGVNLFLEGTTLGSSTNANGIYVISNVPAGTYILKVRYVGYKSISKKVVVKSGETLTQDFVLESDVLGLSEVVVTGVANPVSKIQSSISISSLNMKEVEKSTPRTTAEIFRTIPGVRSEASGGDGNTNITVRGVPISAGGSKYLQLQEDGLPILQFGDIAFATSDIFLRADKSVAVIEAIRGGSASTMATNSPAGIINFISKTGVVKGGSFAITRGIDYRTVRVDFDYGSPIANNLSFHVGGFFRTGEGPRTAGYNGNNG
ncbi:MAG: carboxypeptidase-like regulatory domain-containing protein, partial [Candidatus Nanoarchaeia archaeon]